MPVMAHSVSSSSTSSSSQPWRAAARRRRVDVGQPGQGGDGVAHLGVVLHGARAERVGAEVDGELAVAEPGEVADEVALGDLGQRRRRGAAVAAGTSSSSGDSGTPVVRSCQARRPGSDSSKSVGSVSRPSSGALGGSPAGGGRGRTWSACSPRRAARPSAHRLVEGGHEGVDLGAGAALGHGHQQPVAGARRCSCRRGRCRPGTPRRPAAPPPGRRRRAGAGRTRAGRGRRQRLDAGHAQQPPRGSSAPRAPSAAPPRPGPRCPASRAGWRRSPP